MTTRACRTHALTAALALATTGASAPAAATPTLYGRVNAGVDTYEATGATEGRVWDYPSRSRVFDSGSRVGLRGTEDLGQGMRAVYQIETGVAIDSGNALGQAGTPNTSAGQWASRDSFVGLGSSLGQVTFGRQSLWYQTPAIAQQAANYVNAELPWVLGNNGRLQAPVTSRVSNVVQYNSPTFAGFSLTASFSPNNAESAGAGASANARLWGVTLRFAEGPWRAQYDYALASASTGGALASANTPAALADATGHKLGVAWSYGAGRQVSAVLTRVENRMASDVTTSLNGVAAFGWRAGDELVQYAGLVLWEHAIGPFQLLAQYGRMGGVTGSTAAPGTPHMQASAWLAGVRYSFSRRTWLYATWNEIRNEGNQVADYNTAALSGAGGNLGTQLNQMRSAGADPRILAIGMVRAAVTNVRFNRAAIEQATHNDVRLFDQQHLLELLGTYPVSWLEVEQRVTKTV